MKIQIFKELGTTMETYNDIFYKAWEVNDENKRIRFLACDYSLEKVEEKLLFFKRTVEAVPEFIKEVEL